MEVRYKGTIDCNCGQFLGFETIIDKEKEPGKTVECPKCGKSYIAMKYGKETPLEEVSEDGTAI